MTDTFDPSENPFKKTPCKHCGSKDYAHAKLSAATLEPISCDRCPPKPVEKKVHSASQEIQ